ncbi:MAG: TSUP family transporter [Candidatus Nezhaarchaeales archaeon]
MIGFEAIVFIGSLVVSLLYAWLGLAYAVALILILHAIGVEISVVLPVVLASQVIAAFLGSIFRRKSSANRIIRNPKIIAIAAIAAYTSASSIGIALSDHARLWGLMALLVVAAMLNMTSRESNPASSRRNDLSISIVAGLSSGVIKGVLGGGITPMLIAIQRFGKIDIDETLFRTLFAQTIICLTALIPYALAFGFDFKLFTMVSLGSIAGVALGYKLIAPISRELRVKLVSLVMIFLALALFIKLLLEVICV